ncbi:hypothetical protein T265_10792 [Opisthorchis viverrini]|uniref:Uncharacterized protein n=1 Tax=Opisthorchis viverrini TaxID=6198 RepID=A0A075A012_OPIVI|nr:hypothetical protein T265_10792 [Opisthorchis viverrini]KER20739.1 hypothetical protein T265_10792 [Opisthorchis viverrini]
MDETYSSGHQQEVTGTVQHYDRTFEPHVRIFEHMAIKREVSQALQLIAHSIGSAGKDNQSNLYFPPVLRDRFDGSAKRENLLSFVATFFTTIWANETMQADDNEASMRKNGYIRGRSHNPVRPQQASFGITPEVTKNGFANDPPSESSEV